MATVARWTRFNAEGESVEVHWRATLEKIASVPGGEVIPNTSVVIDDGLVDEKGYVRSEYEKAQRPKKPQ